MSDWQGATREFLSFPTSSPSHAGRHEFIQFPPQFVPRSHYGILALQFVLDCDAGREVNKAHNPSTTLHSHQSNLDFGQFYHESKPNFLEHSLQILLSP